MTFHITENKKVICCCFNPLAEDRVYKKRAVRLNSHRFHLASASVETVHTGAYKYPRTSVHEKLFINAFLLERSRRQVEREPNDEEGVR